MNYSVFQLPNIQDVKALGKKPYFGRCTWNEKSNFLVWVQINGYVNDESASHVTSS